MFFYGQHILKSDSALGGFQIMMLTGENLESRVRLHVVFLLW